MDGQAAWFSACRQYRYALLRCLNVGLAGEGNGRGINFIMLNPSTADETLNDPTITRCIGFASRWQYTSLIVTNLFAFRATDPANLKRAADPVGAENDEYIRTVAMNSAAVVVAWGVHGVHQGRADYVMRLLNDAGVYPYCLGLTKGGHPKHPLYLRSDTALIPCVLRRAAGQAAASREGDDDE